MEVEVQRLADACHQARAITKGSSHRGKRSSVFVEGPHGMAELEEKIVTCDGRFWSLPTSG